MMTEVHRHACALCARRKVKCDKGDPCSNCSKSQSKCVYEAPAPLQKPRKRAADEDLLARLAQYEDLMRKHNIDFTSHSHVWVTPETTQKVQEQALERPVSPGVIDVKPLPQQTSTQKSVHTKPCLWSSLSPELKRPPFKSLRHPDDPLFCPTPPIQSLLAGDQPELHELHPNPKRIYRLWQIFVANVNPQIKIVHIPTLQQRVLDASWEPSKASRSLTAMMFAIYTLSVESESSQNCLESFGESRATLVTRYRGATVRALIAADILMTRDLEVLQALVLFLLADSDSDSTATLTSIAVRLGQKMGLYHANSDTSMSFFDKEMRTRLLWQLHALDSRACSTCVPGMRPQAPPITSGEARLPLNVNDADLHPGMSEPPVESDRPTEILPVLIKLEIFHWFRYSQNAMKFYESAWKGPIPGKTSLKLEDEAITEIESIFQRKYLHHLNRDIPLHNLGYICARISIAMMRFKMHHPRGRAAKSGGDVYMTQEESDLMFESAVTFLEMAEAAKQTEYSRHIFTNIYLRGVSLMDIYVYILSDLRERHFGDRVALAWQLVEAFYNEHSRLIDDTDNAFLVAFGDLTLDAWEAYSQKADFRLGTEESPTTPKFVHHLREKRPKIPEIILPLPHVPDPFDYGSFALMDADHFSSDFWNGLTQFI